MTTANARPARVSVVIVNFNGLAWLRPCLESVHRQHYRDFEVIVVDNGSTDGSADWVCQNVPSCVVVRNAENRGFAEANNQGVAAASGEVIVLLNNDTVVVDGWIEGLLAMLEDRAVAVVTSRVVTEGVPEEFYAMNGTVNFLGYNIMRHFPDLSRVFFAGGASLAFRKADIGRPFPAEYFLYHEDVFLSWRMRLAGRDVRMAQQSVVYHKGSVTTRAQASSFVTFFQERNRLLNALLLYERTTLLKLIPFLISDFVAKLLASLFIRRKSFAGILRAYWWPVRHLAWLRKTRKSVQGDRRVPDGAILAVMSPRLLEGDGLLARTVNVLALAYARVTGLVNHA